MKTLSKKAKLCWQEAARVCDGKDPLCDSKATRAGAFLLASAIVGPCVRRIATFLRMPLSQAQDFGRLARRGRIWQGARVAGAEWFEKDGGIALCLDTAVVLGLLQRCEAKEDGDAPANTDE